MRVWAYAMEATSWRHLITFHDCLQRGLPQGQKHGYTIRSEGPVRLIVVTFPVSGTTGNGWGGFIADVESQGQLVTGPEKAER